ncbi:MAG: DUF898 domain-containing protein [Rhodobacteraceae bacterium]|nr:DUF898 domain-containing protein [Paracoccaceae bacterium]
MDPSTLTTDYAGRRGSLFRLALKTSILTVLTLGIYRFWMKTRLRRYYWSAIRPGNVPLEYTGTGIEKLMGFLVAVVVMAFYIGIFNLILMFFSYSLLNSNFAAYALSFVGVVPIYFYASYRARRYVLARTRWRGVRLGVDPAAWAYAWRAMLHWLASILTLGLLYPRQVFWLEKFRTDRTWFGNQRFHQGGRWTMLLRPAIHLYIGILLCLIAFGGAFADEAFLSLLLIGIPWLLAGLVHFNVQSFRRLAGAKRLGDGIGFTAEPRTARVIGIYLGGSFLAGLILVAGLFAALIVFALIAGTGLDALLDGRNTPAAPFIFAAGALAYFSFFIFWGVLTQVLVTLPKLRHYAETLKITGGHNLARIRQRPRDEFTEAEGFAEALDIGAAI